MNTSSLKTFAQNARNKLRAQVAARLNYWLGAEGGTAPDTAAHRQFAPQIKELAEALKKEGRDGLVERISYTWFNRLAALRFMDANDFHPFGVRVVTPAGENEILPALLQQARAGALNAEIRAKLANPQAFDDILAGRIPVAHPETELFGMLLLAACNYYHAVMPFLFEKLGDATQLLLPEDLLSEQSILTDIRENLTDENCAEVEVIGWLYQFYISEKKAEVDKRKSAVPKEDIPAVTQLFTPHWIVRYLVENSLGRLWLLNRPHSRLRGQMPYYIEGEPETDFLKVEKPQDIKLMDPACGSGHMLTYAFDLLYLIYEEEGYNASEIPSLILKCNLYGLEICDRAAALAAFALCMKARGKDRRFFKRLAAGGDQAPSPHILELCEVRFDEGELAAYFNALGTQPSFLHPNLVQLLQQFEEAKNFGSLIQPCLSEAEIHSVQSRISILKSQIVEGGADLIFATTQLKVLRVLEQAEALTHRYHVIVANPPYMGRQSMNPSLAKCLEKEYPSGKSDLMTAFILRCLTLLEVNALFGCITLDSWMFLSSYMDLRVSMLQDYRVDSLVHVGWNCFPEGHTYNRGVAFVIGNQSATEKEGRYIDLSSVAATVDKNVLLLEKIQQNLVFRGSSEMLKKIPGAPIAYWVSERFAVTFEQLPSSGSINQGRFGMSAADPSIILGWHEVSYKRIKFGAESSAAFNNNTPFAPYDKGGPFRRWYGNRIHVIDWRNDGARTRSNPRAAIRNSRFFCKPHISWTLVTSSVFSARSFDEGFLLDTASNAIYDSLKIDPLFHLAILNSVYARAAFKILNPTLNFSCGVVDLLPICNPLAQSASLIKQTAATLVAIARADWDNFETSWDFSDQPMLRPGLIGETLEDSWGNWDAQCTSAICRMLELETENNRLFIAAYALDGELQPDVPVEQITLARADARMDIIAFVSYAVGCMMGRYSLDQPGLILVNVGATVEDYRAKVPNSTFVPDEDGILPVLDDEWFSDDIVGRFREFLRVTFGEESFVANLRFIEESLGKPEAKTGKIKPTEIRSYFVSEFYKNHISTERAYGYKKRPIYWMVSSPNGSFQALIYLHRYTRDTLNRVLDGYVRPFLDKLEQRQQACTVISNDAAAKPAARTAAAKELLKLGKMLKEIREWERDTLLPLAQKRIEIDLDDGVKVNYLKFKGILVPIAGLEKKEED